MRGKLGHYLCWRLLEYFRNQLSGEVVGAGLGRPHLAREIIGSEPKTALDVYPGSDQPNPRIRRCVTPESGPADLNWTAGFAGALAISPADASPDEAPRSGDLETAKHLGRRVAEFAARLAMNHPADTTAIRSGGVVTETAFE